jgi:LacI family transcriptional regulator
VPSSLADVARRAGVSIATASRALNGSRHPVSARLRERIARAAEEVGYRPSAVARALVTRRSRIIGVIVGDIVDPYFAEITRGIEDHANRAGYLTIVCNADRSPGAELAYVRMMRDYSAEGIVFAGGGYTMGEDADALAELVGEAVEDGIGVLTLAPRGFTGPTIAVDNRAAAADVTAYLAGLGHRRIAFVRGPAGLSTGDLRRDGFRAAMQAAGLEPELEFEGDFDHESGRAAALRMMAAGLPDAVVGANDESAVGVLMAFRQAGVEVPGQVSVAGIGDTRSARLLDLTTVSIPLYELGAMAARRITARDATAGEVILAHRLVPRGTTRRAGPNRGGPGSRGSRRRQAPGGTGSATDRHLDSRPEAP